MRCSTLTCPITGSIATRRRYLAADGAGDAADLAGDPDLEAVGVIVAAVALVDVDAAHRDAGERLQIGDDRTERVAVIGIAVQRLGVQHELAALGAVAGVPRETLQPNS
jgi:hypothetical protein